MIKTASRLADGRELIYFDASAQPGRGSADRRELAPIKVASRVRYDPLQGAWVIYASHRQGRTHLPATDECPLCPSSTERLTEIPDHDYQVAVFENRFPSLGQLAHSQCANCPSTPAATVDAVAIPASVPPVADPQLAGLPAALEPTADPIELPAGGRCEVVSYTSDHDRSFAQLSPERVALVIEALADRTRVLGAQPGVRQVYCFENHGTEIGVTLAHPHGQIYACPFVTPRTARALVQARAYREGSGRNLFDDLVAAEIAAGERVVARSEQWVAFVPHAARWPYELHLYPTRRVPDLGALDEDQLRELPRMLLDIFGRFERLFAAPAPYIAAWHQAPVDEGRDELALHLELFTIRRADNKLKYLAGTESGMDMFASDVMPEAAAARLREAGTAARIS